jgi:hypothetical protein
MTASLAGGVILFVLGGNLLWLAHSSQGRLWGAGLVLCTLGTTLALFLGNLIGRWPYAAEFQKKKDGLWLFAPFKKLYIPIEEISKVEWSLLASGWVVKLKKRKGLLKRFVLQGWGQDARTLAQLVNEEIVRRA